MAWIDFEDLTFLTTRTVTDKYSAADMNSVNDNIEQIAANMILLLASPETYFTLNAVTDLNVSTSKHGFAPTLPNDAAKFFDGTGSYDTIKISDLVAAAWTSFDPTWTNVTIGTGGSAGKSGGYVEIGKTVIGRAEFTLGTSGASVSGNITLTLPVTISSSYDITSTPIGFARMLDSNVPTGFTGQIVSSGIVTAIKTDSTYASNVTATGSVPMTWAASDSCVVTFCYEAA